MERTAFGNEINLFTMATSCPGCNVERGHHHEYGCCLETCAECGKRLIKCNCLALSMTDSMKMTKAIAGNLTRDESLSILDTDAPINSTYQLRGAFLWTCDNAPPQYREEMERQALEIIGGTRRGDMIAVPLDKAAECLGLTEEEARPIMEELQVESCFPGWDDRTGEEQ